VTVSCQSGSDCFFFAEVDDAKRERSSSIYENEVLYGRSFQKEKDHQHEIGTRNGLIDERKRWPKVGDNVMIPYIISSKFSKVKG